MVNIKKHIKEIKKIILKIKEDNISEYAAEAAFFTILSFIPFTLFFLTLIKFTNIDKDTIYLVLKEFIPTNVNNAVLNIIEEIYSKSVNAISFTLLVAIWSAGKGIFSLCKGIRNVYKVEVKSNFFLRIIGSIYTLILIIAIILFLFLIVLGKKLYIFIMMRFHEISNFVYFLYSLRSTFFILIMTGIFFILYKVIGNKKERDFSHIYGAVGCSVSWQIISYLISIYVEISKGFTNMYGSLSSIILIMLWVYACMYIILLGAEINILINNKMIKSDN